MKNSSTQRQQLRNNLLSNGYTPLPLASKGVFIKGWSRAEITEEWIAEYHRIGKYPNTGLRCDDLIAFDIDVLDEDLADQCEDYVIEHAGYTSLCRVGQWPKRLLLYRLDPHASDTIRSGRTGNYGGHMVELLATHGRQFAAFGMHPSGTEYEWLHEPATDEVCDPSNTPLDDLTPVNAIKAMEMLDGLDALLAATGLEKIRNAHTRTAKGRNAYDLTNETTVMVDNQIVKWGDLVPQLTDQGEFGNLFRDDANEWGDSSAVHFYLARGSGEPCAHDFVNDCTHWSNPWTPEFGELLPDPPKDTRKDVFVNDDMADMIENCVILRDSTVRRIDSPLRAYPLAGWEASMLHVQVADPNPPKSNPNKQIPFTKMWKMDPTTKKADYASLRPDHPDESIVKLGSERIMNTYRKPNHVNSGGEVDVFLEFMQHLLPNLPECDLFLDWLSHKVANPGDRMHGMVMVTPAYGTGRGTLSQIMQKLFGVQYVNNIELHDLLGTGGQATFNELLADSLILCVPEALEEREDISKWAARHVAYERLKVVCDPVSQPMHIKRKYGRNGVEQIFTSLFISSNHMDALAIEEGDRRLIVLDNCEVPLVDAPKDLYRRIHAWKNEPANIARLHNLLYERGTLRSTYDAFGEPPMTPAKERMIEAGQSDVDRLFDIFVEQCEGDVVSPGQWRMFAHSARLQYDLDLPAEQSRRENALNVVIQQKARRIDAISSSGIKLKGRPVRPWVIRNFGDWIGNSDTDAIRKEILRNGDPGGSNVVELPQRD